jgi:hypothetical protein
MADFIIETLKNLIPSFSSTQCDFLSENCIVELEKNKHATGCILSVTGEVTTEFSLIWSKEFNRAGYHEAKKITEKAAEAISFFLSSRLTEYSVVEEAVIGTGIDYWLGYEAEHALYDPLNFIQARMEISGIGHETPTNTLKGRVKEKMEQTGPSDASGLPVYVSVVEFSAPKASFGKK